MFKLGEKVMINACFENKFVTRYEVEKMKSAVKRGAIAISKKYEIKEFQEPRTGIVVGVRSIVDYREHFLNNNSDVDTRTNRCKAYLVACDLRGLFLVPVNRIISMETWEDDDFDLLELGEMEEIF